MEWAGKRFYTKSFLWDDRTGGSVGPCHRLFSKTPAAQLKPVIRSILRMGIYELWYMDSVPASATCNEMVKLAKKKNFQGLAGFVNGVLRNVARADKEELCRGILKKCRRETEKLAFMYSVPEELAGLLIEAYGKRPRKRFCPPLRQKIR